MRYEVNAVIHVPVVFLLHCMSTNAKKLAIAELLLLRGSKAAQSQMGISAQVFFGNNFEKQRTEMQNDTKQDTTMLQLFCFVACTSH